MKIFTDSKGFLFSMDVLFSLIIIIVIIGVSADLMDSSSNNMQDHVFRSSFEKEIIETADILIKTPGNPDNWEESSVFHDSSPGLAEINADDKKIKPGIVSLRKILALKKYMMHGNIFPEYIASNIAIYPLDSRIPPISIKNSSIPPNNPEIVVVNRTILCDFHYLNCILQIDSAGDNKSGYREICSHHEHLINRNSSDNSIWICKNFKIDSANLNSRDYYLISESSDNDGKPAWVLDKTGCENSEEIKFNGAAVKLNDKIMDLMNKSNQTVFWLHIKLINPKRRFCAYIISAPKNAPLDTVKIYYIKPQPCYFVVRAWIK